MIGRWVLPAFALAVTTAYWPFWHDGAISPKWCVLSALPIVLFWIKPRLTIGHAAVLGFLIYAAVSAFWSVSPLDSVNTIIRLSLLATAFVIAAETSDMRLTYAAAAVGVSISGLLALAEVGLGMTVPEANHPAALFGNRNYMAEAAAICLVAAVGYRMWWAIPGTALALSLPMSRGAFAAVGVAALVTMWRSSRAAALVSLALCVVAGIGASQFVGGFNGVASVGIRFAIWKTALENLTFFGHGIGSFQAMYVLLSDYAIIPSGRPENAHNEFINTAFEVGVPGLVCACAIFMAAWSGTLQTERGMLGAAAALCAFGFPIHLPAAGFLAAIVAGHLCGHGARVRSVIRDGGERLYQGHEGSRSGYGVVGV